MKELKSRYVDAMMGLVVRNALGVPVEFMSRAEWKDNPVTDMRGYGTHNQYEERNGFREDSILDKVYIIW